MAQINTIFLSDQQIAQEQLLTDDKNKIRSLRKSEKSRRWCWLVKKARNDFKANPYNCILLIPRIQWPILIYEVPTSFVSKLEQKASVFIPKWLKLHKSITSLSFYSSASPCPLPVRSLISVLKSSKISEHLLLKHSQDALVSSCVPKLQAGNWQVEEAVRACETDLKHKSIIGHHQHSHHGLGYIKTSKVPSDKSRVRINDLRIAIRGSNLPFRGSL